MKHPKKYYLSNFNLIYYNKIFGKMYVEHMNQALAASTSVPSLRGNPNIRTSYPNVKSDVNQFNKFPLKNMSVQFANSNKNALNSSLNSPFDIKKDETASNVTQSLMFNKSQRNEGYSVTSSQIQFQPPPQTVKFQFKRSSNINTRMPQRQIYSSFVDQSTSSNKINQQNYSNFPNNPQENQYMDRNPKISELETKTRNLQNQLKFQEKYANDLYKSNEENQKQLSLIKQENSKLKQQVKDKAMQIANNQYMLRELDQYKLKAQKLKQMASITAENKLLKDILADKQEKIRQSTSLLIQLHQSLRNKQELINDYNQQLTNQERKIADLQSRNAEYSQIDRIIQQKSDKIQELQFKQFQYQQTIQGLNDKISKFDEYYRNQLYEERIKQISQELCNSRLQTSNIVLEKNRLAEELKFKNQKILLLTLQSPNKFKDAAPKNMNANQKVNQAINNAFEESIRLNLKEIQNLKQVVEKQDEIHKNLRDEIIDSKKTIQSLRQELRIVQLKFSTERRNLNQDRESKLLQKLNEISSLNNRLKMIEERYAKALKQIKDKDHFLQEHLVGRAKDLQLKDYIQNIMKGYVQTFQSRAALQDQIIKLEEQLQSYKKV